MNQTHRFVRVVTAIVLVLTSTLLSLAQVSETATLYQVMHDNKVIVELTGAGIQHVEGRIKKLAQNGPLTVSVPIGTVFVPGSGVQEMVTINPTTIDLTQADYAHFFVDVACSNLHLSIPQESATFQGIYGSPRQNELLQVLQALHRANASYPTIQAAVWIITDNATFDELGTLITTGQRRLVGEREAIQAMMVIGDAGVNLGDRAISRDIYRICASPNAAQPGLREWCGQAHNATTSSVRSGNQDQPAPAATIPNEPLAFELYHDHPMSRGFRNPKGWLYISPGGLQYKETGNPKDNFAASCSEILGFSVIRGPFAGQWLNIRLRQREYNFYDNTVGRTEQVWQLISRACGSHTQ